MQIFFSSYQLMRLSLKIIFVNQLSLIQIRQVKIKGFIPVCFKRSINKFQKRNLVDVL